METLVDGKGPYCQQPGTLAYDGVMLFAKFHKTDFERNMRSGEDPIMARRVLQLRDIQRKGGLPESTFADLQTISAQDVAADPR